MKRSYLLISLVFPFLSSFAQKTNTFPDNGNVGIGNTTPLYNLDVTGKAFIRGSGSYHINPNNAELQIGYGLAGAGTPGKVTRLAIQPYGHTGGPWQFNARDDVYSAYLDINYGSLNAITVHHSGNVGIGTINPAASLHVRGTSNALSGSRNGLILDNANSTGNRASSIIWAANGVSKWEMGNDIGANGNQSFYLFDMENTSQPRLFVNPSGNIGIGTATPDSKLAVNGKIRAHEIKVETANWPDYVFAKAYELPTLQETEKHIKEKGHLPGIPSAEEVKANGIDLGEMNAKLLQKIEELTLHLIEQNKKMDVMKKDNDLQKEDIKYLKLKLK